MVIFSPQQAARFHAGSLLSEQPVSMLEGSTAEMKCGVVIELDQKGGPADLLGKLLTSPGLLPAPSVAPKLS